MSGVVQLARMSISRLKPSVGGCWLAETCTWYLALWLLDRVFSRGRDIALYFDTRPEPTFETGLHRSVRTVGLFGLFGGRYLHLEVDVHRVDQQRRDRHQPQERSLDVDRIGRYTGRGLDGAFQLEFQQIGLG